MKIPIGRILFRQMGIDKWGRVLYLVIKPTIICDKCGYEINNWQKDEEGKIECPNCWEYTSQNYKKCPIDGCNELMRLRVIQQNNWGIDNNGHIDMLNQKIGYGVSMCKKDLQKQINYSCITLLSAKESVDKKRLIEWTSRDDYDPQKPMPQDIIDYWRYEDQE